MEWFKRYNYLRNNNGLTNSEGLAFVLFRSKEILRTLIDPKLLIWQLVPTYPWFLSRSEIRQGDRITLRLNPLVIKNLQDLPDIAETKELKDSWIAYLKQGFEVVDQYEAVYKQRHTDKAGWKNMRDKRKSVEKQLRELAYKNYLLDAKLRADIGHRRAGIIIKLYCREPYAAFDIEYRK